MKGRKYFKNSSENPDIGENFHVYKLYDGFAEEVMYALNDIAKSKFKKFLQVDADYCLLKKCVVNKSKGSIEITDSTIYSLFKNNEKGIPEIVKINGKNTHTPSKLSFATISGFHADGSYVGLMISEKDRARFIKENKEMIQRLVENAMSQ